MSWVEKLTRVTMPDGRTLVGASFRGVPFFVESGDRSGGRRAVVHEFPLRDDPYVEDLGRRARVFAVDGYIVSRAGGDYTWQRDQLLAALEDTSGPGELVHPYYGTRKAVCTGLAVRESVADGGLARFSIEFTETPAQALPALTVGLPYQVADAADAAQAANSAHLASTFSAAGLPSFAMASSRRALADMAANMRETLGPIIRTTQEAAQLNAQLDVLIAETSSLLREPARVIARLEATMAALDTTGSTAPERLRHGLLAAYDQVGTALIPETTSTRERERINHTVLTAAFRQFTVIEAARFTARASYPSIDEAVIARDAVVTRLDEQVETAGDAVYRHLVQLRAYLVRAVPSDDVVARIIMISRPVSRPSLLLAYQLYGSVAQESDILSRNRVRHPGFVAGELQVLTSV